MVGLIMILFEFGFFWLVIILNRVDLLVLFGLMMLMIVFGGISIDRLLISRWLLNFLEMFLNFIIMLFRCLFGGMKILLVLLCFW